MIIVLAGGRSRRMGRDKGEIRVGGERLLERTVRIALESGSDVGVVGRERPDWWPDRFDVEFLPDDSPGLGPAGGLASGLRRWGVGVQLLACDHPLLDAETISWLSGHLRGGARGDGTALFGGKQPEPQLSFYLPPILPVLERRLATGKRSLSGLFEEGEFGRVTIPERFAHRIAGANTPEEMERLLRGEELRGEE